MATGYTIGVDVGGTFTDLVLFSPAGGIETFKVLSTPRDPSVGVLDGLAAIAAARQLSVAELARQVQTIVHGTTVTTNAALTRGGAVTGLITTAGVRDALEMRRGVREEQYNNRFPNVVPLVPRRLRRPVTGRLDHRGAELTPLDTAAVAAEAKVLKNAGAQAVAICFMNAFANPAHEQAAAAIVRQELPDAFLSVSSDVLPTVRFFNRVSTTVLNAYVGPVLKSYLEGLTAKLAGVGFGGVLLIMQSNGGVALPAVTLRWPAHTLLSGPAGGPRAAVEFTKVHDRRDGILVDMGGTSFDASLVRDGAAAMAVEGEIDRLRIALPMLAITTIGAGGGSIGWIDEGGLLRMGPQSAGALPGPACYDRGGALPTCTDADLALGYLDPDFFAGGKLKLRKDLAQKAIVDHLSAKLGLTLVEAAAGMYRVICANMAHGVREITVKRGLDPREFPLVVAGGAAALHACMIADELEMPTLIVPRVASTLCAAGMLFTDLTHDFVRSCIGPLADLDGPTLAALVAGLCAEGAAQLAREGVAPERVEHEVALDLRYLKQYHELTLPVAREWVSATPDVAAIAAAFHAEHDRLYGYDLRGEGTALELINVRVRAVGRTPKPRLPRLAQAGPDARAALKGQRRAYLPDELEMAEVPVYDGHRLEAGNEIPGPALVDRIDTTIFISSGFCARVDELGSCVLQRQPKPGRRS